MAKLGTILDQIDTGSMLLPEFQRGYVWNRDQVRGFMRSLYLGYPVGALLVWETDTGDKAVRGRNGSLVVSEQGGVKQLLLDGQQRVTSLYGVTRGRPPAFFEGDPSAFTGLYFHVRDETFEFYSPMKMKDDPFWVDVTGVFVNGLPEQVARLSADPRTQPEIGDILTRLMRLSSLLEKDLYAEQITGADKTTDVVVEIFNRVNSGGTKLSKGDLALAKICAEWEGARSTMRAHLARWSGAGYHFSLDWLLRNVSAVATGRVTFSALDDVSADEFEQTLADSARHVERVLDEIAGRLGLDHDRVLMGRPGIAVLSRLLSENGGDFADAAERDKALFWYVHASLAGRFSGATETYLNQDLATIASGQGVDGLIARLRRWRGTTLKFIARDLEGSGKGARFYPLLYLVSRVRGARDLGTGEVVGGTVDGPPVQVQQLFGKAMLARAGYKPPEINAIANFVLLTPESAAEVAKRRPEEYLGRAEALYPGLLASQCLPEDPELWRAERYRDFLTVRRELLARAANELLEGLRGGTRADAPPLPRVPLWTDSEAQEIDIRAEEVAALIDELTGLGLAAPERDTEIPDPETGRALAVAEAVWPDGLQPGQGSPVVLELDPDEADLPRMAELGYEVFTSIEALRGYARRRNRQAGGDDVNVAPVSPAAPTPPTVPVPETAPSAGGTDAGAGAEAGAGAAPSRVTGTASVPTADGAVAPPTADLPLEFHQAMAQVYERARDETGYTATYLLAMLAENGGLDTARHLLASATVSTGFTELWRRNRLDLTVENLVLAPRYAPLFTLDELDIARTRLAQFDFTPTH